MMRCAMLPVLALASLTPACESASGGPDPDADTGADADADADVDADADADADTDADNPPICGESVLNATVRDFSVNHPDFEAYTGTEPTPGLVLDELGDDDKPIYNPDGPPGQITSQETFDQWYRTVDGVNYEFEVEIPLTDNGDGTWTYSNSEFFPIGPDQGFGAEIEWAPDRNFHFTTEIHTEFLYAGGEVFTFTGDDDLWTFINGRLVIDLGGTHPQITGSVTLDDVAADLGLVIGGIYPMAIFHAERHTDKSNFRIDTSIACFSPIIE